MLLLSADDYLAPGALERAVTLMETRQDVVLTYGSCIARRAGDPQPRFTDQLSENNWNVRPGAEFISRTCEKLKNMVPTPTAIVRTATKKKIGGYRKELTHAGDMEMWMRLAANGTIASTPAVQGVYRMHANNMSTDYYKSIMADYRQRAAAFDSFFSEYELLLPDGQQLRLLAKRRLGEAAFWTAVAQCCRGNFETGFDVFRFAWDLNPTHGLCPLCGICFVFRDLIRRL